MASGMENQSPQSHPQGHRHHHRYIFRMHSEENKVGDISFDFYFKALVFPPQIQREAQVFRQLPYFLKVLKHFILWRVSEEKPFCASVASPIKW